MSAHPMKLQPSHEKALTEARDRAAAKQAPVREVLIRLARRDYLTSSLEEVTLEDGKVVSRRQLHPPDVVRVTLSRGYEALERMVEDR